MFVFTCLPTQLHGGLIQQTTAAKTSNIIYLCVMQTGYLYYFHIEVHLKSRVMFIILLPKTGIALEAGSLFSMQHN
jgi:hypothetical protein